MKHTLIILALITATIQTFAQSPRIKLNQITKDSLTGSVLISSPTDSGMVYSRDLFISYGADTVLILGGDTLAATSSIISSVLSDGVTITGDGTTGSELAADTTVLATISALSDSLSLLISSVSTDGVTITGDGTVGSPLEVDTATVVATVGRLLDSLVNVRTDLDLKQDQLNGTGFVKATGTTISYDNSTYLTGNQTITLSGDVTGSGTTAITATVVDDSHNHVISNVDNLQDSLNSRMVTDFSNASGTLPVANGGTGSVTQNFVDLTTTQTVGGAKTFTSDVEIDGKLNLNAGSARVFVGEGAGDANSGTDANGFGFYALRNNTGSKSSGFGADALRNNTGTEANGFGDEALRLNTGDYSNGFGSLALRNNKAANNTAIGHQAGYETSDLTGGSNTFLGYNASYGANTTITNATAVGANVTLSNSNTVILGNGADVGIGTTSPTEELDINGNGRFRSIGSGASAGALHYTSTGVLTTNTSDVRLKTNLQPLENTLQKLLNINTYSFNWINETDRVDLGMVAQEVEEIFPRLVFTNPVDGYKGIHYDKFSSILTKAIQEQQTIIENQAYEIETLRTLITDLSNRLQILENN